MARKGENIYKRKDNRWEGRYIQGYKEDGKPKYGYVYAKTYKEVRNKLHEARTSKKNDKITVGDKRKTISLYCDEWLMQSRDRVKESTYVKYISIIKNHIKPELGDYYPEDINSLVLEAFSRLLLEKKQLSQKTVRDILTVLHSVLVHLSKQNHDVLESTEVVYPPNKLKEMRIMTLKEQVRFASYLTSDMDEAKFGVLLTLCTGMRIGEVCALKWKNIDLENDMITISGTMQRITDLEDEAGKKTKVIISTPKTSYSNRHIPLTESSVYWCKKMFIDNPEAYVLTGKQEHFMEPRTLQNRLKKYLDDCNLEGIHFHTLRHTFATRCVEVDFELKSLSKILGHANSKITLDRYVHSSLELQRKNMQKLEKIGL